MNGLYLKFFHKNYSDLSQQVANYFCLGILKACLNVNSVNGVGALLFFVELLETFTCFKDFHLCLTLHQLNYSA